MGNIKVLSEEIVNKIAAGEVIERPASVLKELIENSLDAEAKSIVATVNHGGRELIRVTDNGQGMSREDAVCALQRHATSKIQSLEDILRIRSFGFRGEALPSIAAVSRLLLLTREPGASHLRGDGLAPTAAAGVVEARRALVGQTLFAAVVADVEGGGEAAAAALSGLGETIGPMGLPALVVVDRVDAALRGLLAARRVDGWVERPVRPGVLGERLRACLESHAASLGGGEEFLYFLGALPEGKPDSPTAAAPAPQPGTRPARRPS